MKDYVKNGVMLLLMLVYVFDSNAETVTIKRQLSTSKAASFWNPSEHGFKFNDIVGKLFTASIKVSTVNNIQFGYFKYCLGSPAYYRTHNDKLVMYETQATELSPSDGSGYKHDYKQNGGYTNGNPYYFYRSIKVTELKM